MRIRWREHEMIFVSALVITQLAINIREMYQSSRGITGINYEAGFRDAGLAFAYSKNVFLPQVCSVLLLFGVYLVVNLIILPLIKRISFNDIERMLSFNIIAFLLVIIVSGYLLAIGINLISSYAHPHLFNYGGFRYLAFFGYNDKPLQDLFFGFGRSLSFIGIATALAGLRELITWAIERPGGNRDYRVLVCNNTTPLVFVYFLILILLNPKHGDFLLYFGCITPVFLVYIYNTFWLFPFKGNSSFTHRPVLIRLLLSTFCCSLLSISSFQGGKPLLFFLYWAFLLFVVTYISWLIYQQRRDQILQLRGVQTALAKSDANLQLLRSQINPHFLFNALNTLYATALRKDSDQTAEGIQKLGDMMRFMLEDNTRDHIAMEKEIDYLKNYISLQKLRIRTSDDIVIEDNIEEIRCSHQVAPMLFIPFVENAFKHGISLKGKSWIYIQMDCSETEIRFEIKNSVHLRSGIDEARSGIGLQNVTERLRLLYPNRHQLYIDRSAKEFIVRLIITTNPATVK